MHIAITGSSGLLGSALVGYLRTGGHTVTRVVRTQPRRPDELRWDIPAGEVDADGLKRADAAIHLAGAAIGDKRWTDERKRVILESRTQGTGLLAEVLAGMDDGPRVMVAASGIDIYGDRGDEVLTEDSGPGEGFLPEVVKAWEAAADPARAAGVRVVHLRFGIVLTRRGGALGRLLPLFRLGLGGRLGSGRQYWPWVSVDDVLGIVHHALRTDDLEGPVNAVAPNPVTNAEFARTLGRVLHRPAVLPVPKMGPAIVVGRELSEALLFTSRRALPERLTTSGYGFRHTTLEAALRDVLRRPA